jgi:biopolymer transport protein ExbD
MKFKRQARSRVELNVIPLIDILFFLLFFVIVSSTFKDKTEISVNLPQAKGQAQLLAGEVVEVVVDKTGQYSVNGKSLINDDSATLKSAISQVVNHDIKRPFLITADAGASHQSVVKVMDAAGQLGLVNLSITTIQPKE